MYSITTATRKIAKMTKRIKALPGGTSAGKTISVLLILIALAQSDESPTITSIVAESLPHLRKGAMRDFISIMKEHNYWDRSRWNATNKVYTFETGSEFEFFGAENREKVKGAKRDRLFVNEANNIQFAVFEEMEVRTRQSVWIDWNPTSEFWYYTTLRLERNDIEELTLTYLDNEALDANSIKSILTRKDRPSWWRVYGLGLLGELEEGVYKNWRIIEGLPHEAKLASKGLDFGFSNDPAVLVDTYQYNGGFIFDERLHALGQSNRQLAQILMADNDVMCYADGSEPKSIAEIASYGVNICGAKKGPGSVEFGIKFIQDQKISVTARSVNIIKAYRNYSFILDKATGKPTKTPHHDFSDPMDAIRYSMTPFFFVDGPKVVAAKAAALPRHTISFSSIGREVTDPF